MKKIVLILLILAFIGAMAMLLWSGYTSIQSVEAFNRAYDACSKNQTEGYCLFADIYCHKSAIPAGSQIAPSIR